MNIRKIVLIFIQIFTCTGILFAQFDAQSSQYMFNYAGFNPAAAGETELMSVTGQHRLNWIDMPRGGNTTIFNVNSPFRMGGARQGIGINFTKDEVGLFVNQSVALQYSRKFKLGKGNMSIGIQGGILSVGFQGDSARGPQVVLGEYHDIQNDEAIPNTMVEGFGADITAGLWYTYNQYFAGLSYSHLNQPVISWTDEIEYRAAGTMYVTGGYSKSLQNPKLLFSPSFMFRTDWVNWSADVSAVMHYNKQYWGGLTYRIADAVVFLAGLNIQGGISIGYSFDLPTNQLITRTWGSHEVVISYQFAVDKDGANRRKKFKNIRFL